MVINDDGIFSGIIIAFVAIVVGMAFFGSIINTTASLTSTIPLNGKSITALNNTAVSFNASDQVVQAITSVTNVTNILTEPANYSSNLTAGTITMNINYTQASETWIINYTYQSTDFINDSAARSITNLIPLFFALAIMAAGFLAVKFDMFDGFGKK